MSIPSTMRAALLTGHGGPEMLKVVENWPVPEVGPAEVLVKVAACGVNNTDIWVREGAYGAADDPDEVASFGDSPIQFPLIQGADIVGTIVATGTEVSSSMCGERVMVDFGIYANNSDETPSHDYLGSFRPGGFSEYVSVPAENAHCVSTSLTDAELATFCCAYITGEHMLRRARVAAGERVLVTGASGGVGSGVIQLCRARGAIPYAIAGAGKTVAVKGIGAEDAVTRQEGDLIAACNKMLGGQEIDVIVDTVSGPMLQDLLEILKPQGRYATCGAMGGAVVEIDVRRIYLKNLELVGATQGARKDFAAVRDYVLSGEIKPLLAGTFPLEKLGEAQEKFKKKDFVGKLVVVMN
ncbi:Alcohol dehydrogenase [Roseibium album]|nr:Alcohol dehydrogenase [Roseibium album]